MKKWLIKLVDYFDVNRKLGKIKLYYKFKDYEKNKKKVNLNKKIDLNFYTEDLIEFVIHFLGECDISIEDLFNYINQHYDKAYDFKDFDLKIKPNNKDIKNLVKDKDFIANIKLFMTSNDFLVKEMIVAYLNHFSSNLKN